MGLRVIVVGGGPVRVAYADAAAPGVGLAAWRAAEDVDLLVGADTISSAMRRLLLPHGRVVAA
ncbi:MAG TPA: hypothetical protein VFC93_00110 [Chloroflexota bacterium]|nr:hypothetical protein [Chloroflexota bacterium]